MTITHELEPRMADLGGGPTVRRLLPQRKLRKVGPWVFLDHFGPADVLITQQMDVRPHPHCGLSTVSYLFEGTIEHRDSTGGRSTIRPGEIHWMRAGHGIVHSERNPDDEKGTTQARHGLQLWCAHPDGEEEQDPRFDVWRELPTLDVDGVRVELLAGHGWKNESPVDVTSPLIYAVAHMKAGDRLALPDHEERCLYTLAGEIGVSGHQASVHRLLALDQAEHEVRANTNATVVILGGDSIGERHIWWNLVHSDKGRLKEQAQRWREQGFPTIPEDDDEFIPAPEFGP